MEDLLYYTCLFDYYKYLFTKTKKDYFIDYYFNPNFKVYYFRFNDLRQNRYHEAIVEL